MTEHPSALEDPVHQNLPACKSGHALFPAVPLYSFEFTRPREVVSDVFQSVGRGKVHFGHSRSDGVRQQRTRVVHQRHVIGKAAADKTKISDEGVQSKSISDKTYNMGAFRIFKSAMIISSKPEICPKNPILYFHFLFVSRARCSNENKWAWSYTSHLTWLQATMKIRGTRALL